MTQPSRLKWHQRHLRGTASVHGIAFGGWAHAGKRRAIENVDLVRAGQEPKPAIDMPPMVRWASADARRTYERSLGWEHAQVISITPSWPRHQANDRHTIEIAGEVPEDEEDFPLLVILTRSEIQQKDIRCGDTIAFRRNQGGDVDQLGAVSLDLRVAGVPPYDGEAVAFDPKTNAVRSAEELTPTASGHSPEGEA